LLHSSSRSSPSRRRSFGPPARANGTTSTRVAIGDVHGAYDRFVEILKVAGIVDGELRWIGGRTHVVQLGDIVDRGDDSRKALDLVRRLERPAQAAGGAWHQLMGNHEVAACSATFAW
jgi:hypothetical protein